MVSTIILYVVLLLCCNVYLVYTARDTLTADTPLNDVDGSSANLVSAGGTFELGFFTPAGADGRFVGIWYHRLTPKTVVWILNREQPVPAGSSGRLTISEGKLCLLDNFSNKTYISTDNEASSSEKKIVKLMETGNLMLTDQMAARLLWQSFQKPTDTFIPGMLMEKGLQLISWRNKNDPGPGTFSFTLDQDGKQYIIKRNQASSYWKSGESSNKFSSDEISSKVGYLLSNINSINASKPYVYKKTNSTVPSVPSVRHWDFNYTRLVINSTGQLQFLTWNDNQWYLSWSEPKDNCSVFNPCGNFGSCNKNNRPFVCKCLPGFKPESPEDWNSGDFSGGCDRKVKLAKNNNTFLRLQMMKVEEADVEGSADNETVCSNGCLQDTRCVAYSYAEENSQKDTDTTTTRKSCWTWSGELNNLVEEYQGGHNLSVRVASSNTEGPLQEPFSPSSQSSSEENANRKVPFYLIIVAGLIGMILLACVASIYIWRRTMSIKQDKISRAQFDSERRVLELIDTSEFNEEDEKGIDVPFFDFQSILEATDNFSKANKLGQGGYGPVYKGKFHGDQEIAVKRLSKVSGQGLQEFRNEVVLIAKLQHRNLVRLKGYCMKGEEKILLYEYMPNKSLDSFIFGHKQSVYLNWEMRHNIILGVARGLLYLHQDSRLRIVHRDLKTSNVLLDEEMNPKISDFGLARIVGGKETEANTNTVVGTYGYMSPEYALDGTFSIKSDVFSFGVVLLEIISGRKNAGFYQSKKTFSLICYAWELWTEDKVLDLMDKNLQESCDRIEFIKCVNVALLCVQEDPVDRPTMSNVITLLDSEAASTATPKQPAFFTRRGSSSSASTSTKPESISEITTLEGR